MTSKEVTRYLDLRKRKYAIDRKGVYSTWKPKAEFEKLDVKFQKLSKEITQEAKEQNNGKS